MSTTLDDAANTERDGLIEKAAAFAASRKGSGGPPGGKSGDLLRYFYRHVATEDLARALRDGPVRRRDQPVQDRDVPAAGHREHPRLHPDRLRARLVRRWAHGRRGGHRRHAVPRRLGDHGAQRAEPRGAHGRAPADPGAPRHHRAARGDLHRRRPAGRPGGPRARHLPRVVDAHRDRPGVQCRSARGDRAGADQGPPGRPRGRRGLAQDAPAGAGHHRRPRHQPAAAAGRGGGRGAGAAALAGRHPLHVPGLPRVPPGGPRRRPRRRRHGPAGRARHRLRHPALRPGHVPVVRQAPAPGPREGTREDPAGAGEGELQGDRAPSGLPRLRRGQDLRRERRGRRRAPFPGSVLVGRLHRVADPDPGDPGQGQAGHRPRRVRAAEPHRQGADGRARDLPARRAVPDPDRRARPDRGGRAQHPRASPGAALRAPRHLRPLPVLPGLPAAGPLHDRRTRADRAHPQGPAPRPHVGVHRPGQRVAPRPAALRHPAQARRDDR